ncbi:MAG: DMT family transporter, partial [Candidatus Aureabacteria bacterium]|nr:DMT family transporter [Candidatus Auribacterota bacterium]
MAEGRHWLGISGMFLSSLLFGLMAFFVRVVSFDASHFFVVFIRSLGGIVLLVLLYFVKVVSFHPVNKKLLVMRGFFGAVALILWFHNIKAMSLSKAVFYFYSYPLYTALASRILYREKVFLWNLAGMGALISGLIILSNLWKFDFQTKDVLGIISGLFAGLAMSFVHELRKTDSAWTIVISFLIASTVMSLPFALFAVPVLETGTWLTLLMVPVIA